METLENWIARARKGESGMFDRVVEEFRDMVLAVAYTRLGDYHLAQDAAQMAFATAFRHLPDLRQPRAFAGWLRRITVSQCSRITRSRVLCEFRGEQIVESLLSCESPQRAAERRDLYSWVSEAVRALPEHQRVVIRLYYEGEHSTARIAEMLGLRVTTVKKRLHDARKVLRHRIRTTLADGASEPVPSPLSDTAAVYVP